MDLDQLPYQRTLFERITEYRGYALYAEILLPWARDNPRAPEWLLSLGTCLGGAWPTATDEDLWELYALSRVNETLLLAFQRGSRDWQGPAITLDEYEAFMRFCGLSVLWPDTFHPFYHEIVQADQDEEGQTIRVSDLYWPCLMAGNLLFSRAGCRVSGGLPFLRKEVAEGSTLYWAYRRKNRPVQDLSHGWGNNSQWRTRLRRDYHIGAQLHFNVDGKIDVREAVLTNGNPAREELTAEERIELLTHRCFVVTQKEHDDLWPYHDTYTTNL